MLNKVTLIGNLGQDPEVKHTQGGTAVCNFSLATNERRKGHDGEWGDHTEWHRVTAFGRQAEALARYITKGQQVYVEGRLETQSWEDRDGNPRKTTKVMARDIKFLGNRGGGQPRQERDTSSSSYGGGSNGHQPAPYTDDDIPF